MSCYSDTLETLNASCRACVDGHLSAATTDPKWLQIIDNIKHETALQTADFQSLLERFAMEIGHGKTHLEAWQRACWQHQRKGATVGAADRPAVLGRAIALDNYAALLREASDGAYDESSALELLLESDGLQQLASDDDAQALAAAPLGRFLIWATFSEQAPSQTPFPKTDYSSTEILTALGLGQFPSDTQMILLTYQVAKHGSCLDLHRPTVADADLFPYYRPHPDASHPWGYTEPLPPYPCPFPPQPEVVHSDEARSDRLVLPFKITKL